VDLPTLALTGEQEGEVVRVQLAHVLKAERVKGVKGVQAVSVDVGAKADKADKVVPEAMGKT
jgi:hypothetical protein